MNLKPTVCWLPTEEEHRESMKANSIKEYLNKYHTGKLFKSIRRLSAWKNVNHRGTGTGMVILPDGVTFVLCSVILDRHPTSWEGQLIIKILVADSVLYLPISPDLFFKKGDLSSTEISWTKDNNVFRRIER